MKKSLKIIIGVLIVLASLNLVYIFFLSDNDSYISSNNKQKDNPNSSKASITFSEEEIYYDGNGELNLMEGVIAIDHDGSDALEKVFIEIRTDKNIKEKTLRYSLIDCNGVKVYGERKLYLENYSGPKINVRAITLNSQKDLERLMDILIKEEAIFGDNGYGEDITASIAYDYTIEDDYTYRVIFTLTNEFNDTYSCSEDFQVLSQGPTLTLKESNVTLAVGEAFNPWEYIYNAWDPVDGDIKNNIRIEGEVDTRTPGEYYVSYYVENSKGEKSVTRLLKVTMK